MRLAPFLGESFRIRKKSFGPLYSYLLSEVLHPFKSFVQFCFLLETWHLFVLWRVSSTLRGPTMLFDPPLWDVGSRRQLNNIFICSIELIEISPILLNWSTTAILLNWCNINHLKCPVKLVNVTVILNWSIKLIHTCSITLHNGNSIKLI